MPTASTPHSPPAPPPPHAPLDLAALIDAELPAPGDALRLHDRYINPSMAAVLRTIGFNADYIRGEGAYLYDDRGRRYIDCLSGYAVFGAGRNHPVIRDALKQAMDLDLPSLPGVGVFRTSGILARQLVNLMPRTGPNEKDPLDTVFFASSGAEAIDAALKHARIATGRRRIIYCTRAYHGLTVGALSINGNAEFRDGFGPLLEHTTEIPFNDLPALETALAAGDVAAFITEPIQGKGVNIPLPGYLGGAAALCRKHGALFILDEIQTGLGRTGRMLACEHFGAGPTGAEGAWTPDMVVLAKALSGGYIPVSALITRRSIHARVFSSMNHCSKIQTTFGQNDLAMVAGLATLHVLRSERIVENAADVGVYLLARLRERLAPFGMVKDIRGLGLMIAIEFGQPESRALRVGWDLLHKLDPSLFCQAVIMPLMADHRILAQVAGHRLDVIKLLPALVLTREDADEIAAAFEVTVRACHQFPGPAWEVGKKLGAAAVKRFAPA
jgi:ornithine--oxo-acid transaminase